MYHEQKTIASASARNDVLIMSPHRMRQAGVHLYLFGMYKTGQITSLLVLARANTGKRGIISGKTEHGETPIETAYRETKEETGLTPILIIDTGILLKIPCRKYRLEANVFTGLIKDRALVKLNEEHIDYDFIPIHEMRSALDMPEQSFYSDRCFKILTKYQRQFTKSNLDTILRRN